MGNRIFVGVVVTLWSGTMSWLMVAHILPPFFHGEPPSHGALVHEPVCWEVRFGDKTIGHVVSQAIAGDSGTTEIHSRIQINEIEVRQLAPQWMSSLVSSLGEVSLDIRSAFYLDSLGNLSSFTTKVRLNDLPRVQMKVMGKVVGPDLVLRVQTAGTSQGPFTYPVPRTSSLTSELVPESKLLPIYIGRKWQQEVYSPFRPPGSSLEIMQAEVVDERFIEHRGERTHARKIEYRTLCSAGVTRDNTLRAEVWVADDGTVLRQDVVLMDARLRIERCMEPRMIKLAKDLLDINSVATIPAPQPTP